MSPERKSQLTVTEETGITLGCGIVAVSLTALANSKETKLTRSDTFRVCPLLFFLSLPILCCPR